MATEVHKTSSGLQYLRTPDERFDDLPDFDYRPRYVDVDGLRMAYLDEGPADGQAVLLLHGEPAWSFLYRRMLPPLLEAGYRCVVPDLIGFGRSDKPIDRDAYSYNGHVAWLHRFLDTIELPQRSLLFAQDWGGLLGLRLVAERVGQFGKVAVGNTGLPTGESLGAGFDAWLAFSQSESFRNVGPMFGRAVQSRRLTAAEMAAYDAPFPDVDYMAGAIAFPALVPITPQHGAVAENRAAWRVLEGRTEPFLTLWCPGDPVLGHLAHQFIDRIPGAQGQPHQTFEPGGHFIQDDRGEDIAAALLEWWAG
ncbi:MAG: haloalkane dehalogenase [Acidimicrobiales bacterium]|nr:alpha/beta fold hydrolase [Acidimicrobiales bacterium]